MNYFKRFILHNKLRLILFLGVFGPATITAMADNDAAGVATYAVSGAVLGYPILFILFWVTILLAITQEMGMRVSLVTRKGIGDLIREQKGIRTAIIVFFFLFIANVGTIIVDLSAIKITAQMLHIPQTFFLVVILIAVTVFIVKGSYKLTQTIMLGSCLFYFVYVFSAIKARPDWGLAFSNIVFPHGVEVTPAYIRSFIIIGLGVLGTTITPWGQFFLSSFSLDKKLDSRKLKFSQMETYWGAFLTNFFSFFIIVATASTLYVNKILITDGNQAALAIAPFAGSMASTLFAFGILNAGFMGIVIIGLSTTYAFSEFFGYSGSLDTSFKQSKTFYTLFFIQLIIAFCIVVFPYINFFKAAIVSQIVNAMVLPLVLIYLLKFAGDKKLMGKHVNSNFKRIFTIISIIIIIIASCVTAVIVFL